MPLSSTRSLFIDEKDMEIIEYNIIPSGNKNTEALIVNLFINFKFLNKFIYIPRPC